MTFERFDKIIADLHSKRAVITQKKGQEYANSDDDRLANFKRIAQEVGVRPEVVCWTYLKKHLDSIANKVRYCNRDDAEAFDGRIIDAITYLELLYAIIKEKTDDENED